MEDEAMKRLKFHVEQQFGKAPKDTDKALVWLDSTGRRYMVAVNKVESEGFDAPESLESEAMEIPERYRKNFASTYEENEGMARIGGYSLEEEMLFHLLPPTIAEGLIAHMNDPKFVADRIRQYLEADRNGRSDILAFFESNGPEMVKQSILKEEEGTPTAADLEELFNQTTTEEE